MALVPPPCPWLTLATGKTQRRESTGVVFQADRIYSFAEKLLKAVAGAKGLVEPSYVYLPGVPGGAEIAKKTGVDFFSVPIELGVSLFPHLPLAQEQ